MKDTGKKFIQQNIIRVSFFFLFETKFFKCIFDFYDTFKYISSSHNMLHYIHFLFKYICLLHILNYIIMSVRVFVSIYAYTYLFIYIFISIYLHICIINISFGIFFIQVSLVSVYHSYYQK